MPEKLITSSVEARPRFNKHEHIMRGAADWRHAAIAQLSSIYHANNGFIQIEFGKTQDVIDYSDALAKLSVESTPAEDGAVPSSVKYASDALRYVPGKPLQDVFAAELALGYIRQGALGHAACLIKEHLVKSANPNLVDVVTAFDSACQIQVADA